MDEILGNIQAKTMPYSILSRRVNSVVNALEDIEKNQIKISDTLTGLRDEERAAQEIAERFDSELRTIKRYVEKCNLLDFLKIISTCSSQQEIEYKICSKN